MLALAACSLAALFWDSAQITARVLLILVPGAVIGSLWAAASLRRSRRIRALEDAAHRLLEVDLPHSHARDAPASTTLERLDPIGAMDAAEFIGIAGALREIGRRLGVQLKEVAKKSRNLEAVIDAMDEPLVATDNQENVLLCNRSAESILDPAAAEVSAGGERAGQRGLIGRPIRALFTQQELLEMHSAARRGQTRRGRVRVTTPLGLRTLQVSALPVPVAWGDGVFGAVMVLRDVTELDHAVQVKTDFVANASHELRTPVAAIRGASETLADALKDDPAMAARLAAMINSHALRLEELLRDLLDLSRLESQDVPVASEPMDLGDLPRTLAPMFETACEQRGLTLSFEFEPGLLGAGPISTDRRLLLLILRNLIENATKFANERTTIRVVGRLTEARLEAADPTPAQPRPVVRFEVTDRGVGIPLQQQERVFERFFQVDPARTGTGSDPAGAPTLKRGTGLGLAIVKHAAKRLGGRVGINSVYGQGTTVWVEVPTDTDQSGRA
jgi:two-component system phosphate regulon sensor histidine kinase PhoR